VSAQRAFWDRSIRRTRVKLCEFESLDAAFPACRMGADALGFHMFKQQDVAFKTMLFAGIFKHLPAETNRTLLTDLDADVLLENVLPWLQLHTLQLYPDWTAEQVATLRARAPGLTILKVMSARPEENFAGDRAFIDRYKACADGFLLDSIRAGGSGKPADWDHCAEVVARSPLPVFLAGGLTAENVGDAIRRVKPFGVDVETGVSDRITNGPLIKNLDKCRRFLEAVRQADAMI